MQTNFLVLPADSIVKSDFRKIIEDSASSTVQEGFFFTRFLHGIKLRWLSAGVYGFAQPFLYVSRCAGFCCGFGQVDCQAVTILAVIS
jgi:hypothetical protein